MSSKLVIVESPAKAKTIQKFLGKSYTVIASNGHVRDLPKSTMGIDVDNDYEPKYITIRGKGELLSAMRKEVRKADKIFLATDPDREGEAISWHLYHALKLSEKDTSRITFNEITKDAVKNAIKNSRDIDMDLVDAQQARRVLDRIVGYKMSPILWAKIKRGLSAGRVQSVALRIIADRESEINDFIPSEYWSLKAMIRAEGSKKLIEAVFAGTEDGKQELHSKKEVDQVIDALKDAPFEVLSIKTGERKKKAPLPFTTSTLQQESSRLLNFSTQRTMRLAQELYEGVHIKGKGTIGLITYLRTDSTRISAEADAACRNFISEHYGDNFLGNGNEKKTSGSKIQDAHEAIRPTDITITPESVKNELPRDLYRLYNLIWSKFVASRMADAVYETMAVKIGAGEYRFTINGSRSKFDGYLMIYQSEQEKSTMHPALKKLHEDTAISCDDLISEQHFTQPPAHYTEASIVKALEDLGIGRPSTYAPTITTLLNRRYVVKENKNIYITELGEAVNEMTVQAFPSIVDVNFTATMESMLDSVEEGKTRWKTIIEDFYPDMMEAVEAAQADLEKIKIHDEETDVICTECGKNMVIKYGPHGKFLACPGFPDCKNTMPYFERIGVSCPTCGKDIVIRKTKKGRKYYGCIDNPDCDFMSWLKPVDKKCPKCGSYMVMKAKKYACSDQKCGCIIDAEE